MRVQTRMPAPAFLRAARQHVLLLFVLMLPAACSKQPAYVPPPPPRVTIEQPVSRVVTDFLEATGNTDAVNTVQLRARVTGYLDKVLFQDGEKVKKGQLLFLLQQNTYQARLQQAEAQLLSQKANLDHAATEFARFADLVQNAATARARLVIDVDDDIDPGQMSRQAASIATGWWAAWTIWAATRLP